MARVGLRGRTGAEAGLLVGLARRALGSVPVGGRRLLLAVPVFHHFSAATRNRIRESIARPCMLCRLGGLKVG